MIKYYRSFLCLMAFSMFSLGALPLQSGGSASKQARECVLKFLSSEDKRSHTFHAALQLLKLRGGSTIVETGTARCGNENLSGDGGSSLIFANWVGQQGGEFYSVDIDRAAILKAQSASLKSPSVHFVHSDSVAFLKKFHKKIDLIYLDSYDYDMNMAFASQEHHLNEIIAAYDKLHDKSIILIDDCALEGGGKGKLVIEFLRSRGWKILHERYQVLLTL
jgi:hypothetical protein